MIPEETINKIRQVGRDNLLEIVQQYAPNMKKKGNSYWSKSPFQPNEKTPSFHVVPSKGFFKCWSTGKGGDAIKFIQEIDNKGFIEAVRTIGELYEIPIEGDGRPDDDNQELFKINKLIHDMFITSRNEDVDILKYLNIERGLSPDEMNVLEIGYCPKDFFPHPNNLPPEMRELYIKAGILAMSSNDNLYYVMRDRLTIPIKDYWGNICGFTCRAIRKDQKPKYINTPETKIYKKGELIQGLYHAKGIKDGPLHLVEGPFDRVPFIRAGKRSGAICGTALTKQQAKLIKRVSHEVNNCFDGDSAGQRAMFRAIPIQLSVGLNIHVLQAEIGKDPMEMGDCSLFQYMTWYRHCANVYTKLAAPLLRSVFVDDIREMIMEIGDPSYRNEVIVHLMQLTGLSKELLSDRSSPAKGKEVNNVSNSLEYKWIQYMANYPEIRMANWETLNSDTTFDDARLEVIKLHLFEVPNQPYYTENDILDSEKIAPLFAELFVNPPELDLKAIRKTTIALRVKHIEFYIQDGLKNGGDPELIRVLQEEKLHFLNELK